MTIHRYQAQRRAQAGDIARVEEGMKNARWAQNSPATYILKMPLRAGGAVLATIETKHFFHHAWTLPSGRYGVASSLYAAQRMVRAALRGEGL